MTLILSRENFRRLSWPIAVIMTLFQLYYSGGFETLEGNILYISVVCMSMVLVFLQRPAVKVKPDRPEHPLLLILDLILVGLAIASSMYLIMHTEELMDRMAYVEPLTQEAIVYGVITVALVLEMTRRLTGFSLCVIALCFLAYFFWGQNLPGIVGHKGFNIHTIIENLYITSDGIYGGPTQVAVGTLLAFVMFGTFLDKSKMSTIFMELACLVTRNSQGGPAKVAIFASCLFGTISGSAPSNVYTTGTFTIPMMKKCGYRSSFAGAVEAVASTGGQIMPPVMGAAAFLMAELTGLTYLTIVKSALIPALLFYFVLFIMIHFEAKKRDLGVISEDMVPQKAAVVRKLYYLLPLFILGGLLVSGSSPAMCAKVSTLSILVLAMLSKATRFTLKSFFDALAASANSAVLVVACCACSGIIVGTINLTGIGFNFINLISYLANGSLLIMLLLVMGSSFVLGMGVPTAPAYIIVASLAAPALIKMGIAPLVAHFFVFYYAILSAITPPVCIASYAGASIAEADPLRTGFVSMQLGLIAFIVPFMFVYSPALLWIGAWPEILQASLSAVVGGIAFAAGLEGYLLKQTNTFERVLLIAAGVTLIYPGTLTDIAGLGLLAFTLLLQRFQKHRS